MFCMSGGWHYFWSELAGVPVVLLALAWAGPTRRPALLAGALFLPLLITSFLFDGTYWQPPHVLGWRIGVEDVLFSLRFGILSWLAVFGPWGRPVTLALPTMRSMVSAAAIVVISGAGILALMQSVGAMQAVVIVQCLLAAVLLFMYRAFVPAVARGVLLFSSYYALHVLALASLITGFTGMWSGSQPYWATVIGVPIEEFLWAASACVCYPLVLAVAWNAQAGTRQRG
jgi:hypothetical protein